MTFTYCVARYLLNHANQVTPAQPGPKHVVLILCCKNYLVTLVESICSSEFLKLKVLNIFLNVLDRFNPCFHYAAFE